MDLMHTGVTHHGYILMLLMLIHTTVWMSCFSTVLYLGLVHLVFFLASSVSTYTIYRRRTKLIGQIVCPCV